MVQALIFVAYFRHIPTKSPCCQLILPTNHQTFYRTVILVHIYTYLHLYIYLSPSHSRFLYIFSGVLDDDWMSQFGHQSPRIRRAPTTWSGPSVRRRISTTGTRAALPGRLGRLGRSCCGTAGGGFKNQTYQDSYRVRCMCEYLYLHIYMYIYIYICVIYVYLFI